MGMPSSQARLLSLTSRMHDIEYKAQRLEAQKLQMANESQYVYLKYENALNKMNIQTATIGSDGSTNFIDANLLILENNGTEHVAKNFYLKNINNNKVYVSQANATKYNLPDSGIAGSQIEFMDRAGFKQNILSFEKVQNSQTNSLYNGVSTTSGSVTTREVSNFNPDWGYQTNSTNTVPQGAISVSSVTGNFDKNKTYVINTKEDLVALSNLTNSGKNTQGVNFVLGADIDMSGINWNGIGSSDVNAFKGIFDGNGYTISNLTGNCGLFNNVVGDAVSINDPNDGTNISATYGIIRNVSLQNVNITKTSNSTGALIGQNTSGFIDNCFASGTVNAGNWAGGLIGYNIRGAIKGSTSNVNVNATGNCVGGFIGHDTNGIMENCISTGTVDAKNGYSGGFIGHETANGSGFIYKCATTSNVVKNKTNTGAFLGQIDSGSTATVIGSQYSGASGLNPIGSAQGTITSNGNDSSLTQGSTKTVTTTNITIPSKNSVKSNILYAIEKSSQTVDENFINTKLDIWLNQFYKENTKYSGGILVDESLKLASINDFLNSYLKSGANENVVTTLISDINNNSLTTTKSFQNNYKTTKDYEYTGYSSTVNTSATKITSLEIGSLDNIANNIYTALRKAGYTEFATSTEVSKIQNWVKNQYGDNSANSKLELANINSLVTSDNLEVSEISKLRDAINNNSQYSISEDKKLYNDKYATYNISTVEQTQNYDSDWDMSNPAIAKALEFYEAVKDGYILVDDVQASNKEWLVNMINSGNAVFTEYDKFTNKMLDTNIATNTSLQEIADDTELKKAEAEYEANMRKIDAKDKKFDTDLAALESERNAIKTEIDTLKTVAKDNVDRTFKLFG